MAADGRIEIDSTINGDGAESGIQDIIRLLETMAGSMDRAASAMESDGRRVEGALQETAEAAKTTAKKIEEAFKNAGDSMKSAGETMTASVTAPLAAVGGMALKTASDYEGASARMQAQLGLTAEETERLGGIAKDVYKNAFGESIGEVSESVAVVQQHLGEMNDQDLRQITEQAYTIADLFGEDITASTATAKVMIENFGIDGAGAMDLITVGMQKGGNYSGELLDTMREYSPAFSSMGMGAKDMMNVLIAGTEAGAWSMDKVGDAVKEFNIRAKDGSDSTAEGFAAIGLNAEEMGAAIAAGGAEGENAYRATIAGLASLDDEQARTAAGVALFGTQWEDLESDVILAMSGAKDAVGDYGGATEKAAAAAYDTFGSRFTTMLRTAQESLLPLGEQLLGLAEKYLPPLIDKVVEVSTWFSGLSDEFQMGIIVAGGVAAALGPLLVVLGTIVGAITPLIPAFAKVFGWLKKLKTVFTVVRTAMLFFTGPIGLITAAVIGLGILIYKNWDAIKAKTLEVFGMIRDALPGIWAAISTGITNFLTGARDLFVSIFTAIGTAISNFLTGAKNLFISIFTAIGNFIRSAWSLYVTIVTTYINIIKTIITTIFTAAKNFIVSIFTAVGNFIRSAWNLYLTIVTNYINLIKNIVTTIFTAVKNFITTIFTAIGNAVRTSWNFYVNLIRTCLTTAKNIVTSIFSAIKNFVSTTLNTIKTTASNILNKLATAFSTAINKAKDYVVKGFQNMLNFVKSLGSSFYNAGKGLIEQVIKGIKAMIGKVTGAVKDVAGKIRDFLPFSPAKTGPLSDLDKLDFGGPVQDSLKGAIPKVRAEMAALLTMPTIAAPVPAFALAGAAAAARAVTNHNENHFTIHTQPGQNVDVRALSRELYALQKRDQKGAGRT